MGTTTKVVDREYLTKQFKNFNDTLVKPGIEDLDDRKVDKVAGKGLSKNDFTDELKTKLEDLNIEFETDPIDFASLDDDEFTYTKTPGTISKLFVHLYRDGVYGGTDGYKDSFNDTIDVSDIDTEELNEQYGVNNFSSEATDEWYANRQSSNRSSDYRVVDADGVTRYEFGNTYCEDGTVLGSGINFYKIDDNTDIVVVFDVNITNESNLADIKNAILNYTAHDSTYDKILEELTKDQSVIYKYFDHSSNIMVGEKLSDTVEFIRKSFEGRRNAPGGGMYSPYVQIVSSDKLFDGLLDGFPQPGNNTYNSGACDEFSFNLGWYASEPVTDSSTGFHGMNIIQKALETGRALDIAINVGHICGGDNVYNNGAHYDTVW